MAGKLSPQAQQKLNTLRSVADKVQTVHGQVERYAAAPNDRQAEALSLPLKRTFGRLKVELMGVGFDAMSQLAGSMEIAAGRGGSQRNKARILREGVASLRSQVDIEQRKVASEGAVPQPGEDEENGGQA